MLQKAKDGEPVDDGHKRCTGRSMKFIAFSQYHIHIESVIADVVWDGQWGSYSVAAARADVFHIWRTRAAMNLKIGMQIDEIGSRGVRCQL